MNNKSIEIIDVLSLRGPNIWTYRPVLEAWVDIGDLEDFPSNTIPGFYERLTAWLPSLVDHHCGVGVHGGFLMRLREGTWPGHIMEHVMIELQNLAGMQSGFGKARETGKRGVYKVVVRSRHEEVSRAALYAARDLVMAAIQDKPYDVKSTVDNLRNILESVALGPSTGCIVEAATDRRIPSMRLNEGNLVQLGYGIKQRRIWTAETDQTSAIAETISRDKELTKTLLQSCGVPVPEGSIVDSANAAWNAAENIGLPVVVKPLDGNHGRGVSINLNTEAEVRAAFELAEQESSDVIVERFVRGDEHRLLVVGGKLVAAARGEEAWITCDGVSTVMQLIESQLNSDPRRGSSEEHPLNLVLTDPDDDSRPVLLQLARQGFTTESVPKNDERVLVQRNGNVSCDVTDLVHPSVAAIASLAARIVGLDIAGVDLVVEDISKPLNEQGGAIVEVNAGPGLLMHLKPADGPARPVGRAIVDHLFAEDESGRIPIVGVTGSHGTTAVSRLIAWLLHLQGTYVGLACKDGLFLRQRHVLKKSGDNWDASRQILINRMVETAVFENSSKAILSEGLAYDWCQVGVVTNIDSADSLPDFYIDDADQMSRVARTQVDVVLPTGVAVLNADDARVAELASLCDGSVIFFATSANAAAIVTHLEEGQRAVFLRDDQIVLASGKEEILMVNAAQDRSTLDVETVLAAIAAAWALGVSPDLMRVGIESFEPTDAAIAA
ncbi:MAG: cyanophycin synthetase [Herminiimonas sp.]|uniref:cyanophycin synthetase n=1 Tax=Herminiimonas sp. TaxID=1926289 RepID=UPI002716519A|nr:cyanophycin synthetase [Herminiimonas sp.]MDO9420159.1 cyanophycin synthetase [Herminiimonas sp.]